VTGRVMRVRLQLVRVTIAFVKSVNPLIRNSRGAFFSAKPPSPVCSALWTVRRQAQDGSYTRGCRAAQVREFAADNLCF
jgi:hypothetical protein